jgi:signal transduction histidine kinase
LIYKDIVVGLLVTQRKNCPWQQSELEQIETIAQTLAIARLLDSHQQWYQEQLSQQQTLQQQEHDRLDDLFHQLRNPLTALQIFGKLLLKRLHSDEKSTVIAESIVRESDHLQELLQEFEVDKHSLKDDVVTLDTRSTRSLPSEQSLSLSAIQVTEILEPLLTFAESIAQEKSIELRIDILEDSPCIWGDTQALREVFSNIINNAFKYTPSGGQVFIQVGLLSITNGKSYQGVVIEDTGCGIPVEDQEHIFERHYRGVQEKGEIVGSGLGLAIAKDLVTQMQGLIELVSPTDAIGNMGTKFIVWLLLVNS